MSDKQRKDTAATQSEDLTRRPADDQAPTSLSDTDLEAVVGGGMRCTGPGTQTEDEVYVG